MDRDYIIQRAASLTTEQLLKELSSGEQGFQEGVYTLYREDALRRGISLETLPQRLEEAGKQVLQESGEELFKKGVILLLLFVFLGIPSFIIGIMLHRKDNDGTYRYTAHIRSRSWILILIPAVAWSLVLGLIQFMLWFQLVMDFLT